MVCKECGKEIPEGRMYCDECLADLESQEQEVITISRMDVMRANKKSRTTLDLEGFIKNLPKQKMRLIMFVGAILMYLSPFLPWMSSNLPYVNVEQKHRTASLFALGGKNDVMALNQSNLITIAILLMIAGLMMLLCSAKGYVPVSDMFEGKIMMFLPAVISVLSLVWFFVNKSVRASWKISVKPSIGLFLCIIGLIMYVVSIVMEEKMED